MPATRTLARAEVFIRRDAPLLDRRLFEALFQNGPREPVLTALRAYQNEDGGFGHALRPDLRGPESQPGAAEHALRVLDAIDAFDDPLLEGVLKFLTGVTCLEGGIPQALPGAPGANGARGTAIASSLDPTAAIVGLLRKHGFVHPWVDAAADYCWRAIAIYADPPAGWGGQPPRFRTLMPVITFLEHAREEPAPFTRAEQLLGRIGTLILEWDLVAFDPGAPPCARTPLDWAPSPHGFGRRLFTRELIDRHVAALAARQEPDGGWPARRRCPCPAAERDWRGWQTIEVLRTLRAYGALQG